MKRIPKSEYINTGEFTYNTYELFMAHHTQQDWEVFIKWMNGQTSPYIPGEVAIFSWDYERWVRQGKKTNQNADDWD